MTVLALAGDTMLGRGVAEVLSTTQPRTLVAPEVVSLAREADAFLLNLECCVSDRGHRWPAPGKPFFFRAPPRAIELLTHLGVDCVTLANNHALDYGADALADTLDRLAAAGIHCVGAGHDEREAREAAVLDVGSLRIGVLGLTDHPADFAAGPAVPGVAYANLRKEVPAWVGDALAAIDADVVLVTPHWGPNRVSEPVPHVRRAAAELMASGATLIAGHSAHVFHGVTRHVIYDLGDFLDDYATDPVLRNDLGLLFLVELDATGLVGLDAIPLELAYCQTRLARGDDAQWVLRRFAHACAALGTRVRVEDERVVVRWR